MKITIELDRILAAMTARRLAREAELRRRGIAVFTDWLTRKPVPPKIEKESP